MIPILPSSAHPADRPVRLPVPHALRKALPSSDRAEAALAQALDGVGIPPVDVSRLAEALAGSTGHAILAAPSCWTDAQLRWAYVVILHHLGDLNARYGKLFDVADRGLDHTTTNAPVSKTKAATGMHTDSSDAGYNPDLVALLCLQPGASGGRSLLADAQALFDRLCVAHPELVSVARTPWPRDVVTPGLTSCSKAIEDNAIPVFSEDAHGLIFRYMRFWTERAMAKLDRAVPEELTRLFDFIDADMDRHAIRFQLRRGDMLVANNRTMVHGREAFENAAGCAPRCLVRAWVDGFVDGRVQVLSRRA